MSKLKVAKAVRGAFKVGKWLGFVVGGVAILSLLWMWANAHFFSFAIIIGIILAVVLLATLVTLWDWSVGVINTSKEEEREEQERERAERMQIDRGDEYRLPVPKTVPRYDDYRTFR